MDRSLQDHLDGFADYIVDEQFSCQRVSDAMRKLAQTSEHQITLLLESAESKQLFPDEVIRQMEDVDDDEARSEKKFLEQCASIIDRLSRQTATASLRQIDAAIAQTGTSDISPAMQNVENLIDKLRRALRRFEVTHMVNSMLELGDISAHQLPEVSAHLSQELDRRLPVLSDTTE